MYGLTYSLYHHRGGIDETDAVVSMAIEQMERKS